MPAVDPKKLKRLMISELLAPFAMKRRLCDAQLSDLVHRAMEDKRFDLSVSSDTFVNFTLDEAEAANWAQELERSNTASHLFSSVERNDGAPQEMIGGMPMSDFLKLPPETRLAISNREDIERAKKN
jgi:hypothetical protein